MLRIPSKPGAWSLLRGSRVSFSLSKRLNSRFKLPIRDFCNPGRTHKVPNLNEDIWKQRYANDRLRISAFRSFSKQFRNSPKAEAEDNETVIIDEESGITSDGMEPDGETQIESQSQATESQAQAKPSQSDPLKPQNVDEGQSNSPEKHVPKEKPRAQIEAEWMAVAQSLEWSIPPTSALPNNTIENLPAQSDSKTLPNWFSGGQLNIAFNCLNHPKKDEKTAVSYFNEYTDKFGYLTFKQLRKKVNVMAGVLRELGVGPGDNVLLYLFNSVELVISVLACMQIGAVFFGESVRFGTEHVGRVIHETKPKIILSMSCHGRVLSFQLGLIY